MKKVLAFGALVGTILLQNVQSADAGWIKDEQGKFEYYEDANTNLYLNQSSVVPAVEFGQYYQADPRWADKRYGMSTLKITGCAPTSLAMIISTTSESVTPVEVADFIFNTTNEMNTTFTGTSSLGVKAALTHWNLKAQTIASQQDLEDTLKSGEIVYAAVGHGLFVNGYSTHAIILSGYENGQTKAIDPDSPAKTNRWYSINDIWNERSLEPEDNAVGGAFMAVYK